MAANQVVGIAVLDKENHRLHIACEYPGGAIHISSIQIKEKGSGPDPEPGPCWEYEIDKNLLVVRPSVKITTTMPPDNKEMELFHNSGEWSVEFVDASDPRAICHFLNRRVRS